MTAPDLLVCPSCNRQKEEFWPDGFCGPDVCLNPDCNSQVAAPAPDAAFASGFKAGLKAAAEHWFRGVSGVRQLLPETKAQILAIPCPQPAPAAMTPDVAKLVEVAACAAVDWFNGDYGMSAAKAANLGVYRFVKRRTLAALRAGENNGK